MAARQACDAAGLTALDWVAPALEAAEHGSELLPPFDDQARVWDVVFGRDRVLDAVIAQRAAGPPRIDPKAAAMPALFAAVEADPLRAAVDALYAAATTFGEEYGRLFEELRSKFPNVS